MPKRKRKNKNIILSQEASDFLRRRLNRRIIPYNPTIIEDKIFVSTADPHNDPDWVNMTHYREIREKEVKDDNE